MRRLCQGFWSAILIALSVCVSGAAHAWIQDPLGWPTTWSLAEGVYGSYMSVVKVGDTYFEFTTTTRKYSPTAKCPGDACPGLGRYSGPALDKMTKYTLVAPNTIINDIVNDDGVTLSPTRMFTRGVVRKEGVTGKYWAFMYVSDGYPAKHGRVYPAMLSSPDGIRWTYLGQIKGEPWTKYPGISATWGSGMAFHVRHGVVPLDHARPTKNKFYALVDAMGPGLQLIYSADGTTWYFAKKPDGTTSLGDIRPPELIAANLGATFASTLRLGNESSPERYLMAVTDKWPPGNIFVEYSCDFIHWVVLGDPTKQGKLFQFPDGFRLPAKDATVAYYNASTRMVAIMPSPDLFFMPEFFFRKTVYQVRVPATIACPA